jgi:hypothetical protein
VRGSVRAKRGEAVEVSRVTEGGFMGGRGMMRVEREPAGLGARLLLWSVRGVGKNQGMCKEGSCVRTTTKSLSWVGVLCVCCVCVCERVCACVHVRPWVSVFVCVQEAIAFYFFGGFA